METTVNSLNLRDKNMKLVFQVFLMTFISAGFAFSQPKLSIDNPEINLGHMYSGEKKKGKIILKNIGNDTLRIYSVKPQCGCTTVKKPKEFLLPGESDDIELEFSSAGYRGKVEKQVSINSNDPTSQYITVMLVAEIIEILQPISGSYLVWMDNTKVGKSAAKKFAMKNVSGSPIIIRGDSVSSEFISIKLEKKTLQPNDTLNIDVMVLPNKPGRTEEHFYILTSHKILQFLEIKVAYWGVKEN